MMHVRDLKPHPKNREIYGDEPVDEKLVESIRQHGVMEPLVVTRDGMILSGHRRWRATMSIDPDAMVEVTVRPPYADEFEELETLLEYNRQREKTVLQRMAEAAYYERIEAERAKRRQGTRTDIPANLPEGYEPGETREKVAAKVGMGARTYAKAKKVVEAADSGDEKAQEVVKAIDAGEMSIDRAYKEVTGKSNVTIQIIPQVSPTATGWHAATHLNGEMPAVGERALAHIRDIQARVVPIDRILYNHTPIEIERLERLVLEFGGAVPVPDAREEAPAVVIPPEVLAIGPDKQVHIAAWYQYDGMEKPDRHYNFQPICVGLEYVYEHVRRIEEEHPGATFPKFKVDKFEVSREVFEALRPWGRMEDEKEHTVSIYYTAAGVPLVEFFDGVPTGAARKALEWLRSPAAFETVIRRIHFADGAGSDMDISREGLARLAMPAPAKRARPATDLDVQYLELIRDEIKSMLELDKCPYESVVVAVDRVEVTVPPVERLPDWITGALRLGVRPPIEIVSGLDGEAE